MKQRPVSGRLCTCIKSTTRRSPCCRQNYFGEGSMACIMGLMMGTILLASQELLGKATLHSMLTFNPGNFFT